MALISIPSSISGITIPGISSRGPLGLLFGNPFTQDILHYPRDLNSLTKGHSIQFTVYEVTPLTYEEVKQTGIDLANLSFKGLTDKLFSSVSNGVSNLKNSSGLNFQPKREKPIAYVHLYMPESLAFTYPKSYDDSISAVNAVGSTIGAALDKLLPGAGGGALTQAITSGISQSGPLATLGLQKAGYAVNPQLQVLFQGINFREFTLAFTFTPYSKDEAIMVEKIVKTFKKNSAPRIVQGVGGMFFIPPASFGLDFKFNGQTNKHINKVQNSVITNIDVNYTPNGWSAHDDGVPVQTTLSLSFKELVLNDSAQIENGY
jgi:hypothetical protein